MTRTAVRPKFLPESNPKSEDLPENGDSKPSSSAPSDQPKGPAWEPLTERPTVSDENLPPKSNLKVGFPTSASPFVQVVLPAGEVYRGKGSHSRSFKADASASSSSSKGRATLSQAAASAQCVAWAWEWFESQSTRAAKRSKKD